MSENPEGSKEAQKEQLRQQINETRDQIRSVKSNFNTSMVDTLLTQPGEKVPDLVKVIKKTQMAALPVSRDTRRHLAAHEIAAGGRTAHETYPVFKNLFKGLTIEAASRLPRPERGQEGLVTSIRELDKHLFRTKPEIPHHFTNKQEPEGYRDAINRAADVLAQINPDDETQGEELTFLFNVIYNWADYASDSSPDPDYNDGRKAKVVEDLFIEMLSRLKRAEQVPDQEDFEHDVPTTVSTMVNQFYSEEMRLEDQLYQLWDQRHGL